MSHIRYWASTMLLALAGGFLIVESQAFAAGSAAAIAFAVAIVVTALALVAIYVGRARERRFSLLPACAALIGGWTIVAMNVFSASTEKWLAFASGAGVLGLALCALTLHELTVERVVHALEVGVRAPEAETPAPARVPAAPGAPGPTATAARPAAAIGRQHRGALARPHVRYWLAIMLIALAGGFLIVESQAFAAGSAAAIAFAVAIVVTALALVAIYVGRARERRFSLLPACAALIGGWTIVAMNVFSASTEKWLAFASGAGVLGLALCALTLHELTVERVVHALELGKDDARAAPEDREPAAAA